ncbi:MAG: hypothetical protein BGO12_10515 [Verrucomicrobia bacterium 61-8]|nr:hypothetical protein [Verrucomicrobiota bacterium]OJV20937.1 MAG: hypothetical protein BGO12_10515 [Verrucomicrobia bacterium 61-8]
MKLLLMAVLCLCLSGKVSADDHTFAYGASPSWGRMEGNDLVVSFNLRRDGEIFTPKEFRFSPQSSWRSLFEDVVQRRAFQGEYFEIVTSKEIAKTASLNLPHLDVVTKETLRDLSQFTLRDSNDPDLQIIAVRRITQNEFLHVNPRTIPDPTK